jgi:lipoyl(octanoyl) transferase
VTDELWVCRLGVVEYREALTLQLRLREAREAGTIPDVLLLLEHPPVYTKGRRSDPRELGMGEQWYLGQGIDVVEVDRGGRVTYHGPGQLVGYPIMQVGDVVAHLRTLERAIVAALAEEGIEACGRTDEGADYTGVWVGERKIASLGVHVRKGITTHGFAVNVDDDLQPFEWIVPCGLQDVRMTSITRERGERADLACFRKRMGHAVARAHDRRQRLVSPHRVERELGAVPLTR